MVWFRKPVTAAATRIKTSRGELPKIVEASWEDRAWSAFDRLPELHYGVNIRRNIAKKFDYFVARRATPVAEPDRLGEVEEDETISPQDQAVIDVFDAEGGPDLLRRLVADFIPHFDVVGRAFNVAFGEEDRVWEVLSTQELREQANGVMRRVDTVGKVLKDLDPIDPDNVFVVWRPHPRNRLLSDSPLKASLEVAEQLVLLRREMKARSLSRLNRGILALPDSMDLAADEEEDDPAASFERDLTDRLTRPISDAGSAGSVVPWIITADADDIEAIRHITMDIDWEVSRDDREELVRSLANGMDIPPEIMLGLADVNHWTAWQVNESAVTQHVDPTVTDILASLTVGWFLPLLEAAGVDSEGVVLWRDITPAIVPADRTDQHFTALAGGVIGFDAVRERLGYDEEEAPNDDDLALIAFLGGVEPDSGLPRGPAQSDRPGEASVHTMQALPEVLPPTQTVTLDELAELDAGALDFVLTQAEAALDRVLEKAGARLRSEVQGNSKLAAIARDVPNAELGFLKQFQGRADAVTEADFNPVMAHIRARLGRTQVETRRILSRLMEQDIPEDPDEEQDLEDGSNSLLAILLAAALAALFTPGGEPDPADIGELRDLRLPVSEIRDAISQVGGGAATYADSGTWELIANGRRTHQRLQDRGAATLSFKWQYGDPASRVTNFDPHRRLNNVMFDSWDADVLAQTGEGAWVAGSHFRPGDHRGCLCRYTREITLTLPVAASG